MKLRNLAICALVSLIAGWGLAAAQTLGGYFPISYGSWTPTLNSWTNVGTPTAIGTYVKFGPMTCLKLTVIPATSISSTANTSNVTGAPVPPAAASLAGSDATTIAPTGNASWGAGGTVFTPTFGATSDTEVWSGCAL